MNSQILLLYGRILVIAGVLFVTTARPVTDETLDESNKDHLSAAASEIINDVDKDEDYDSKLAEFYDYYPDYDSEQDENYHYTVDDDDSLTQRTIKKKNDRLVITPDPEENNDIPFDDKTAENETGTFLPIPMPTDFESYDVNVTDGFITLTELAAVTGARENVELAFKASDVNGDGRLTLEEFKSAPLMLQGETPYDIETLTNVERQLFTDENAISDLVRKLEKDGAGSLEVEKLKNTLTEVQQNEKDVEETIGKKLFDDDFQNDH